MNKRRNVDCRFLIEIGAFIIAIYGISACVFLNGDDFMYATFAKTGIISNVTSYYFSGNGRFWINILDAVLLCFDRFGFIMLLPWIALAFVVLVAKNIQRIMDGQSNKDKEKELIRTGMVLFCCMDVMCLRETVFWITGMMNYLLPAVMFLWAYLMFQKSRAGELSGASRSGYYLLCLLTASSAEQYALMFVGMLTLHYVFDLIKKYRPAPPHTPRLDWIAYCISLGGLALLLLAPGNFVRVDTQGAILPLFVDNAWTLLYQNTFSPVALPFVVMLTLAVLLLKNHEEKYTVRYSVICSALLLGVIASPLVDKAILYVALLVGLGCLLVHHIYRNKITLKPNVWFLLVVGIGSQVMLLISSVWGFRCMWSMYLVYMLVIGCLLYRVDAKYRLFVIASGILVSLCPAVVLAFWLAVFLLKGKKNCVKKITTAIVCCGSAVALLVLLNGYGQNVQTHEMNLRNTAAPQNQTIVIWELPDDTYSWYFVPIGEFHEEYYRILYGIPEDYEIIYQATEASASTDEG